ncbi:ABC transporter ATP-binding protein [Planctomycetota bacterium]
MVEFQHNLAIQTVGLTKIFRDFWGHKKVVAVDNLDLDIQRHQVYGLLGPNGSGKSTTIKMLLGLLFPSRGVARVLGQLPGDVKTNSRIGYLPEESHLYPFLSARETLDFYGRLFGLGRQERRRRTDSLLDMVGLSGVGRRPMGEFSKGMARRLGLAQALINDPDLLILDEPTAGLDPLGTRQIKDLILHLGQRGKTVLLCSHLLADVEDVCDRIGILYGGKMQVEGEVGQLLTRREMTQIRAGRLSVDALERIKDIIRQEDRQGPLEVKTPRDRLEDYFLRIVTEARASETETSGAIIGSGVSDFLGSVEEKPDESEIVIEQLVTGREPAAVPNESGTGTEKVEPISVSPSEEEKARREVLESLVETSTESTGSVPAGTEEAQSFTVPVDSGDEASDLGPEGAGKPDPSLIDELTTGLGGGLPTKDTSLSDEKQTNGQGER